MKIRSKLTVSEVTELSWSPSARRVRFTAQYDDSIPEDQRFQKYTPSASAEYMIDNPALIPVLRPGAVFYVDFIPVEEEKAAQA